MPNHDMRHVHTLVKNVVNCTKPGGFMVFVVLCLEAHNVLTGSGSG